MPREVMPATRLRRTTTLLVLLALALAAFGTRATGAQAMQIGLTGQVPAEPGYSPDWEAVGKSGANFVHFQATMEWFKNAGGNVAAAFDPTVELAAKNGVTLLPYFYGRNVKVGSQWFPTEAEFESPSEPWGQFMGAFAERYGPGGAFWTSHPSLPYRPVTTYEIWNEENWSVNNPGGEFVQPAAYAKFLRFAYNKITAKQPSAAVLMGGLVFQANNGTSKFNVPNYLTAINEADKGLTNFFTGVSMHSYATSETGFQNNVETLWATLATIYPGKRTWVTEFGWPTEKGEPSHPQKTEEEQALILHESFDYLKGKSVSWGIDGASWFIYRDTAGIGGGNWENHCGLLNSGGAPKQAWFAFEEETGVGFWPVSGSWSSDNLGGNITSNPDIASWAPGRFDVFAKGTESNLVHDWYGGGFWGGWGSVGGGLYSGPGAVSSTPNRIDIVGRGADNSIVHWWWNGAGWFSDNLGGGTLDDPDISDWGTEHLDVFLRGGDNNLWHKFWNGAWSGWELVGGPELTSGPSSVSWGPGRIDVVARVAGGSVGHWWWTGSGWGYDNLGGKIASKPTIASPSSGRLDVFAQGVENALWHDKWVPGVGAWSGWERIGGPITSAPGAVASEPGRIDVVARYGAASVGHWWSFSP